MSHKFNLRKLAPKAPKVTEGNKFTMSATPKKSKARVRGNVIEVYQVKVAGRNASVNEANAYLDATMKKLFAKNPLIANKSEKIYQINYKLSDGRYYTSKQFSNAEKMFYPDLKDEQYGIDHSEDLVEHINIMVIESIKNPLSKTI